jgi:iron complex outermembrane receptor protein
MYAQARASITSPLPSMEEAYVIGGVRHDRAGAVSASSPSLGVGLRTVRFQAGPMMDASFSLRGSLNRSFRAPTFNELYYSGGGGQGNSDLQPEYSSGVEAGGTFAFVLGGDHAIDVSLFSTRMEGRIVWSPAGQGIVMPKNLRQVDSDGYEASYTLDLFDRMLRARAYYGNARAVNAAAAYPGDPLEGTSLVYVPVETGGATLSFVHRLTAGPVTSVGGTLWYAITGPRFMTEDNLESLPMYDVLDLALSVGMAWWGANVGVRCEVHNILNEDYQCIRGYPMPLRTVRLGLAIDY